MAVYVELSEGELQEVCRAFKLGALMRAEGIPQGTVNTNYRLETDRGRFFLRHTTVRPARDVAFEAALLEHLATARLPLPTLLRTPGNSPAISLRGGLVSVFEWLSGCELRQGEASFAQAAQLGETLARFHLFGQSFSQTRVNPYGPETVRSWLKRLEGERDSEVVRVLPKLKVAFDTAAESASASLPKGPIHADLFVDNVKWDGEQVSALFDFEMACTGPLTLDLAVTLQSWCFDGNDQPELARALVQGYQCARPLEPVERRGLWGQALFGAVRFTTSRIRDIHLSPLAPEKLSRKDFRLCEAWLDRLQTLGPGGLGELLGLDPNQS